MAKRTTAHRGENQGCADGRSGSKIHLSLNSFLSERATTYMKANGVTITELIRRALKMFLYQEENYWQLVFKNLENTSMETRIMHEEVRRFANAFLHFVYYWFMLWPDTEPDKRKDMIEKAYVMVEKFSQSLSRRLSSGGYLTEFKMEDIKALILENAPELDAQEVHELMEEARKGNGGSKASG